MLPDERQENMVAHYLTLRAELVELARSEPATDDEQKHRSWLDGSAPKLVSLASGAAALVQFGYQALHAAGVLAHESSQMAHSRSNVASLRPVAARAPRPRTTQFDDELALPYMSPGVAVAISVRPLNKRNFKDTERLARLWLLTYLLGNYAGSTYRVGVEVGRRFRVYAGLVRTDDGHHSESAAYPTLRWGIRRTISALAENPGTWLQMLGGAFADEPHALLRLAHACHTSNVDLLQVLSAAEQVGPEDAWLLADELSSPQRIANLRLSPRPAK
jgi:hypothetical protein